MNTFRKMGLAAALVVGLGFGAAAGAQTVGYNIRTGDVWVDTRLGEINDYGYRYRDPFIHEMTGYYGAPRSLIDDLLVRRRWAPADVYYACALAHALGIPCIGTDVGGVPELLDREDIVPPGDALALAARIREVVGSPSRLASMSARNLARAREYAEPVLARRRDEFYRQVRDRTQEWLRTHPRP